jgi:hypothetical protein
VSVTWDRPMKQRAKLTITLEMLAALLKLKDGIDVVGFGAGPVCLVDLNNSTLDIYLGGELGSEFAVPEGAAAVQATLVEEDGFLIVRTHERDGNAANEGGG